MKKILMLILILSFNIYAQSLAPVQNIFMQGNNINAVFRTDGYFNFDIVNFLNGSAGLVWPSTSPERLTGIFTSGLFIGAKVGPQRELRVSASFYNTHYSPGNIPVIGQVPPSSVCSDPSWRGYYVQLTDPSLISGGTRYKTAGGRQYTFNYDSWAAWPVQKGAPYVEVNGIPGYQPDWNGDRPGIGNGMTARPEELLFMVYMDYTNCRDTIHSSVLGLPGGTLPLGAEIQQLVYNFNCLPLRDMYFISYRIINKSNSHWDSLYISNVNDADIGNSNDDATGCDSTRNLSFTYNFNQTDPEYGNNPPVIGIRMLQTPIVFTGINSDTLKLPYDTLIGYITTGMSGFNGIIGGGSGCTAYLGHAINAYNFMRGKDGCGNPIINWVTNKTTTFRWSGNACYRYGWFDSTGQEKRMISSMGSASLNSGDTQIVVMSYMITRDGGNNFQNVCALQSLSDSALKYYYNDFRTCVPIGIEPISSEIPQKFELLQNYPNPFNPATKIRFHIPLSRGVSEGRGVLLKIYDVLGKEIATLVNEDLKPGIYEIKWNAEDLPSGVYFYSLITNEFTHTKKMVVVK